MGLITNSFKTWIGGDFKGTQCALCDEWRFATYTVEQDVALCPDCADLIPDHIPTEQVARFAMRLIEGRKDGFQGKVVR